MSAPPAIHEVARRLLAAVPIRAESPRGDLDQAAQVCEKVRSPLARLAGAAGFYSLLSRALALAKRQAPSLDAIRVEADGSLGGFDKLDRGSDPAPVSPHGGVVLVAELLGLLITLIGESLTLSIMREIFPDALSVDHPTLRTEETP